MLLKSFIDCFSCFCRQNIEPDWMGKARSSIRRSIRRSITRLSFRNRYHEQTEKGEQGPDGEAGFGGQVPHGKRHGRIALAYRISLYPNFEEVEGAYWIDPVCPQHFLVDMVS